jgi:hypothetical protein
MRAMKRALPFSACLVALAACGGGGSTTPDANISTPPAACTPPTQLVDVTGGHPVGDGTAASCTEAALDAALAMGGVIYFNCGDEPITIVTSAEKAITANVILDGGGKVTLDGGGTHRLFSINTGPEASTPVLTVQRLIFAHGQGPAIDGGGGAISRTGGTLIVNQCVFTDNHGTPVGQDIAGGAIWSQGTAPTMVVGSIFLGNSAANGGAIGNLGNSVRIFNSRFEGNRATGTGGNPGMGGNGGAVSIDGMGTAAEICGSTFSGNQGNAFGGALFRLAHAQEATTITRSTFKDNTLPADADPSTGGGVYLQGTAATITQSAFVGNRARRAGGLYLGTGSTVALTDSTFTGNQASAAPGGGLVIEAGINGSMTGVTIVNNGATAGDASGGGVAGDGASGVTLSSSIIAHNQVGSAAGALNCARSFLDGGGNLQFPLEHGGGSDDPGALCAAGVIKADPLLGDLTEVAFEGADDTTWVLLPQAGSPALVAGATCSTTDQRGKPRAVPCTSGAVEP